jgi:hypothetical protein
MTLPPLFVMRMFVPKLFQHETAKRGVSGGDVDPRGLAAVDLDQRGSRVSGLRRPVDRHRIGNHRQVGERDV